MNILKRKKERKVEECGGKLKGLNVNMVEGIVEFEMRRIEVDNGKIIVMDEFMKEEKKEEEVRK